MQKENVISLFFFSKTNSYVSDNWWTTYLSKDKNVVIKYYLSKNVPNLFIMCQVSK